MDDFIVGAAAGVIAGMFLGGLLTASISIEFERYHAAISECEKDLPRSERCVIVGVKAND